MDSLKHATALLYQASNAEGAAPLLEFLGFHDRALPLDSKARCELGLHETVERAFVARGQGALRALVIEANGSLSMRELAQRTAGSLGARVAHLLWIVIAIRRDAGELGIVCWRAGTRNPRVVALIARRDRIIESDAETLCTLSAARSTSDILTHVRWVELLGREAITRRFFRSLKEVVDVLGGNLPRSIAAADRRELAILTISRLLFLSFIETKGWLAGDFDFLANQFARCMAGGGQYHRRVLLPLFFGTLNTRVSSRADRARAFGRIPFLNGGLFNRSHLERAYSTAFFPDESLSEVFSELLTSFRFSAREDTAAWSETAVDPEILGKAFEALMAAPDRKTSGAFYTPQRLVEHVTESALVASLSPLVDGDVLRALLGTGEIPAPGIRDTLLDKTSRLLVLDPACGSGAFLVHCLDRLAELRLRLGEIGGIATIRRRTLASSIFGVDVNPMAVWLCQLRLWLSIVIDSTDPDPMHVKPLPNLDRQIRIGDSLAAGSFSGEASPFRGRRLNQLRARYVRSVGARKKSLAHQLDREERREALDEIARLRIRLRHQRQEAVLAARSRDLFGNRDRSSRTFDVLRAFRNADRAASARQRRLKAGGALPFAFAIHFSDVAARGGFNVIVGNPPWVRIHNIGPTARAELQREFLSFSRGGWRSGAELSGSGPSFAGQIDLASLFIERSVHLLQQGGALSLLVPVKIWRSLSGGGIRQVVAAELELVALEDLTDSRSGFDAAVYPSVVVGRRKRPSCELSNGCIAATVHRGDVALQWEMRAASLPLDDSPGSPWLLMPPQVRAAFDKVTNAGIALARSEIARPLLGVKTGCNSAFLRRERELDGAVEREMLRPIVRGETLTPWTFRSNTERIIWTHDGDGAPLKKLPEGVIRELRPWRVKLERRTDGHGSNRWWSLFRTEGASPDAWRVAWSDFGKSPRSFVIPRGSDLVPLNTVYVARCRNREEAVALMVLLNGPLLASWLGAIAEPARGGFHRYLGWTMSLLPLPQDWPRAVTHLLPAGERALSGDIPTNSELLDASLDAYRLRRAHVEALISWTHRS